MDKKEIKRILLNYCDRQISDRYYPFIGNLRITYSDTRILEPWEMDANLPLPEKICFPENSCHFQISREGVKRKNSVLKWSSVLMTAIATYNYGDDSCNNEIYVLIYTEDFVIIKEQISVGDRFYGLLGHFIELYKKQAVN